MLTCASTKLRPSARSMISVLIETAVRSPSHQGRAPDKRAGALITERKRARHRYRRTSSRHKQRVPRRFNPENETQQPQGRRRRRETSIDQRVGDARATAPRRQKKRKSLELSRSESYSFVRSTTSRLAVPPRPVSHPSAGKSRHGGDLGLFDGSPIRPPVIIASA